LLGSAIALAVSLAWAGRRGFRWPWRSSWRIGLATSAMGAMLAVFGEASGWIGVAARVAVGGAVYAAWLVLLHLDSVRTRLRRR
jgi:hypothetical protein